LRDMEKQQHKANKKKIAELEGELKVANQKWRTERQQNGRLKAVLEEKEKALKKAKLNQERHWRPRCAYPGWWCCLSFFGCGC
jgi:hypothetical protein